MLLKNVFLPLAKVVLITLDLMVAASAKEAAIQKEMNESGAITLIILNWEIENIMKIVKSLKELGW